MPEREPDLQSGGDRLWRVEDAPSFDDVELLIETGTIVTRRRSRTRRRVGRPT